VHEGLGGRGKVAALEALHLADYRALEGLAEYAGVAGTADGWLGWVGSAGGVGETRF